MEKIIIQGKTIEFENEEKKKYVENILYHYLGRNEHSLEQKIIDAVSKHKKDLRAYGESLRELIANTQDGEVEQIVQAGVRVNVLLDRLAFPSQKPTDPALEGWPPQKYFPDGFSFLSYSDDTQRDSSNKSGEKIRIDKLALIHTLPQKEFIDFSKKLAALIKVLPKNNEGKHIINSLESARKIYQEVSDFIQLAYQTKYPLRPVQALPTQSVLLSEYVQNPTEAVCRHKELLAQVMMQLFGIPGEILECHMFMNENMRGNHLATILNTEQSAYLIDFTNPDRDKKLFMERINHGINPDSDFHKVLWKGMRKVGLNPKGMEVTYLTKQEQKNVYYRILHGWE